MPTEAGKHRELYLGGICVITDRESCSLTCLEMTRMALNAGIRWVQLRDKKKNRRSLYRMAVGLRELTRDYGAYLVINDFADIAASVDADGVHLGQTDLPVKEARKILGRDKLIGISTHSISEALRAERDGADYLGFGPICLTRTKDAGPPKGAGMLRKIKGRVHIPVVAIGGICPEVMEEVFESGADAVAAASSILKGDVQGNARVFLKRLHCI